MHNDRIIGFIQTNLRYENDSRDGKHLSIHISAHISDFMQRSEQAPTLLIFCNDSAYKIAIEGRKQQRSIFDREQIVAADQLKPVLDPLNGLPADRDRATLLGRVWRPGIGPSVVTIRGDSVVDVTSKAAATVRDITEAIDPATMLEVLPGETIGTVADILANSDETKRDPDKPWLL